MMRRNNIEKLTDCSGKRRIKYELKDKNQKHLNTELFRNEKHIS